MEVGQAGLKQEPALNHVEVEVKHLQDHVQIQHLNMVEMTVQGNHQRQKTATHRNALSMVDGLVGLNQEAVLNHVEQDHKNMFDLVQILNHSMEVPHVQENHQRQKTATHRNALSMVDGLVGLNQEAVLNHVEQDHKNMLDLVQILNHSMEVPHVPVQLKNLRNATLIHAQCMVDGLLGASLVAVLNPVELEVKNMSDLVQIPNQPMVVTNV